ncbi:MAG: DNA phosphorothioation system sulfurtransferase DndC [Methylococcales bacterium]
MNSLNLSFESNNSTLDATEKFANIVTAMRDEYLSEAQNYPWIVGFSGGKDSTLVAHAVFDALLSVPPSKRTRHVHIVSNDTLVESPLVVAHLHATQSVIEIAAQNLRLPVTVITTQPDLEQSFWVNLIGRGYPTPNQTMRWCTDRLKIQPSSRYILDSVSACGAAIILLGVRSEESNSRRISIEKRGNLADSNLSPHSALSGALVYRPIVDLTTDEVWEILASQSPPWGGTHRGLIQLYRDAEGGECPVVLSKDEAAGCGTNSSRFGCWTCTVVDKDKSLQGFVDSGKSQYSCLINFRDWIKSIRNDPTMRQVARRNGQVTFNVERGIHIPGPFTIQARGIILQKLLETQAEYGEPLISEAEIQIIRRLWTEDLIRE